VPHLSLDAWVEICSLTNHVPILVDAIAQGKGALSPMNEADEDDLGRHLERDGS
jgi:hypothetical protein